MINFINCSESVVRDSSFVFVFNVIHLNFFHIECFFSFQVMFEKSCQVTVRSNNLSQRSFITVFVYRAIQQNCYSSVIASLLADMQNNALQLMKLGDHYLKDIEDKLPGKNDDLK